MKKLICTLLLLAAGNANSGLITQAVSVTTPNEPDFLLRPPANLIDQSGLSNNYVSGVTDFDSFVSATTAEFTLSGAGTALGGAATSSPLFEFDLGSVLKISGLAIWNQSGSASVNIFDVYGSVDGVSYTLLGSDFGPPVQSPSAAPAYVASWIAQDMRYVQLDVTSNYGYSTSTRFNEIAFDQIAPVSVTEPKGLALLAIGLAGLGVLRRKKRFPCVSGPQTPHLTP